MRVGHLQVSRPPYYDRNPIDHANVADAFGIPPHATTIRWSYMVPTGKLAWIDGALTHAMRTGAPAAASLQEAYVQFTAGGGNQAFVAVSKTFNAAVGTTDSMGAGTAGLMQPGDDIFGITFDVSTGGTMAYTVSAKVFEFTGS